MRQYRDQFKLEAERGITFSISEKKGILSIKAMRIASGDYYSENHVKPEIPKGYVYVEGTWDNGFVIRREVDGSEFVWVPVGSLEGNGTMDGEHFTEKFGRRKFNDEVFIGNLDSELLNVLESVKMYGGFYISRYNISKAFDGRALSVKERYPWVDITYDEAERISKYFEYPQKANSHLTFGEEYDSLLEWLIESGDKEEKEVIDDSTKWGNHFNTENAPQDITKTGSNPDWVANRICDLAGNVDEWTQEKDGIERVIRGGVYSNYGNEYPVASRDSSEPQNRYLDTGFRICLTLPLV